MTDWSRGDSQLYTVSADGHKTVPSSLCPPLVMDTAYNPEEEVSGSRHVASHVRVWDWRTS